MVNFIPDVLDGPDYFAMAAYPLAAAAGRPRMSLEFLMPVRSLADQPLGGTVLLAAAVSGLGARRHDARTIRVPTVRRQVAPTNTLSRP
jgi:hypothetical protein